MSQIVSKTSSVSDVEVGAVVPADSQSKNIYSIGTLRYTMFGLINVFVWLLWGDFCMVMLESIVPKLFPLVLKDTGASNALIGIMIGSVHGIINLTAVPIVSVRSDRYRSRLGRRIPYLLWTGPLSAILLIMIGYINQIGDFFRATFFSMDAAGFGAMVPLVILCVLITSFHLFNSLMLTMYQCLLADVVPPQVIGKFMATMRTVSLAAKVLFSRYVFGLADTHREAVFLIIGLIFLASFLLMCWRVKEGSQPPIETSSKRAGVLQSIRTYARECFTMPFYLAFFMFGMVMACFGCFTPFYIFFYRDTLGLSLDDIGKLHGWGYLFQAVACIPIGWVCDRIHPIPTCFLGVVYIMVSQLAAYFFLDDWNSVFIFSLLSCPGPILYSIGQSTMGMTLLPKAKYGQFASALSVITALGVIGGNFLVGILFDLTGQYRLVFLGTAVLSILAIPPLIVVYRGWKKYGGPRDYVPPEIE